MKQEFEARERDQSVGELLEEQDAVFASSTSSNASSNASTADNKETRKGFQGRVRSQG